MLYGAADERASATAVYSGITNSALRITHTHTRSTRANHILCVSRPSDLYFE